MKLKSKSQVTMLMIIGLALFIIVSLVLYLSKSAIKKQNQQNIKNTQQTAIDSTPVKEFIGKCLDKLAKDALVLLGKQGGYIYTSQGGTHVDYSDTDEGLFFIKHDNLKVAYNILPPKFEIPPFTSEIPEYPWTTFPYKSSASNEEAFEGYFGVSNLPPLNPSGGPNSIQTQMEAFIDNNIATCADFNIFKSQGYDIYMGKSKTHVTVGSADFRIKSEIPTKIVNAASKETVEIKDFSAGMQVNLLNSYFFAKYLIENDIKNIKFGISTNSYSTAPSIMLVKNAYSDDSRNIKADLVILTDGNSLVYGKPLQYTFAIRNRAPALYYIRPNIFSFPDGYLINETDILQNKPLAAEDTDGDSLTFKIYNTEFGNQLASFPVKLILPYMKFRVEVSDGQLSDYQLITVNKI